MSLESLSYIQCSQPVGHLSNRLVLLPQSGRRPGVGLFRRFYGSILLRHTCLKMDFHSLLHLESRQYLHFVHLQPVKAPEKYDAWCPSYQHGILSHSLHRHCHQRSARATTSNASSYLEDRLLFKPDEKS